MRAVFCVLLLAVAACGSSTEPRNHTLAGDPSLRITNNLDHDWVYVDWADGDAVVGRDSVAPRTVDQCVRFLAQPDSAKWIITATQTGNGFRPVTASVGGVFFNPADRPAWDVIVDPNGRDSPLIMAWDSAAAVNGSVYGKTRSVPTPC